MKPLYARPLAEAERDILRQNLKSSEGFSVRRAHMLLLSADQGLKVEEIGRRLGCRGQAVREAIHAFHAEGLSCLQRKPRARKDDQRALDDRACERLKELIRPSPRSLGYETSLWTLELLAEVSHREGLTDQVVHPDTISASLQRMGIQWKRAKHWIHSPDPHYVVKKNDEIG